MKKTKCRFILIVMLFLLFSCQTSKYPLSPESESANWEIVSNVSNVLRKVFFIDFNNGWVVGDSGKIFYTNNGGKTWQTQNSGTTANLTSLYFIDNQKGFTAGYHNTLLYTHDGGNIWNAHDVQSDSSTIYSSICSDENNNLWFISNYGDLFCSTNLGKDWILKNKLDPWGYSHLSFPNSTVGFAMDILGVKLMKTTDGGNTWNRYQVPTRWSRSIYFLNEHCGWITENWGPSSEIHDSVSVYNTTDGGETWICQASIPGLSLNNINFVNTDKGWVSQISKIYHTLDGGKSWNIQFENKDVGYISDIYFLDEINGWAITFDGYFLKFSINS